MPNYDQELGNGPKKTNIDYLGIDRRTALRGLGSILGGGLLATGTAAASDKDDSDSAGEHGDISSKLAVEDGRVIVIGGRPGRENDRPGRRRDRTFDRVDPEAGLDAQFVADIVNDGIDRGHLKAYEEDGRVMVASTISSKDISSSFTDAGPGSFSGGTGGVTIQSASCGQNDLSYSINYTNTSVHIWMDHDVTDMAALMFAGGATASAVATAVLAASGVGTIPAAAFAVIAAALTFFSSALAIVDDGCGVVISFTQYYITGIPPFAAIDPQ